MKKEVGLIFEIKRFAVHDGPGIRTTVFFKGCPLRCVWCHNPEGLSSRRELSYLEHKCINCHSCVGVCPNGAHWVDDKGVHRFQREKCTSCGACVGACLASCLTLYGREASVEELMEKLLEDKEFYECSDGGITISGGECLMQADFCAKLLAKLKEKGIHTAVDTCGFVPQAALHKVLPYTDLFLYDLKAAEEGVHRSCTGQSNASILENLRYLSSLGKPIEIRIPFVPGYNDGQMEEMARLLAPLSSVTGARVLPYHNYAQTKYASLGLEHRLPERLPTEEELERAKEILRSHGVKVLE